MNVHTEPIDIPLLNNTIYIHIYIIYICIYIYAYFWSYLLSKRIAVSIDAFFRGFATNMFDIVVRYYSN